MTTLSLVATNYFTALLFPTIELVLRGVARLETHRAHHSHITLASPSPVAPSTLDRSHLSLPDKMNIPIKSKGDPTPILNSKKKNTNTDRLYCNLCHIDWHYVVQYHTHAPLQSFTGGQIKLLHAIVLPSYTH